MSLIVGKYFRGDLNIKPVQWGTPPDVLSAIFDRLCQIYIEPKDLLLYLPFWAGGQQYDYAMQKNVVNVGTVYNNYGLTFNGSGDNLYISSPSEIRQLTNCTTICHIIPASVSYTHLNALTDTFNNVGAVGFLKNTLGRLGVHVNKDGYLINGQSAENEYVAGQTIFLAGVMGATGNRIYKDGRQLTLTYSSGSASSTDSYKARSTASQYQIGCRNMNDYDTWFDGTYLQHILFSCVLTHNQISYLSDNPYFLIKPRYLKRYFLPAQESSVLPINLNRIDEITKGHGPITAAQLGGHLIGG